MPHNILLEIDGSSICESVRAAVAGHALQGAAGCGPALNHAGGTPG